MEDKKYYIVAGDLREGPFTLEELGSANIRPDSRVYVKGGPAAFFNAGDIEEINNYYFVNAQSKEEKPTTQATGNSARTNTNIEIPKSWEDAARREAERRMKENVQTETKTDILTDPPEPNDDTSAAVPPPPIFEAEPQKWHALDANNRTSPPMTITELQSYGLTRETKVWCEGMNGWTDAYLVPELASLLPQEMEEDMKVKEEVAVEIKTDKYNVTAKYGHPSYIAFTGLFLSLLFVVFALTMTLTHALNDVFAYTFTAEIVPIIMALPVVVTGVIGGVAANMAKQCNYADKMARAVKLSGAATAYGIAAIIMTISLSVTLLIMID